MSFIFGVIIGAGFASIGWFFVWKNNKRRFEVALESAAYVAKSLEMKLSKVSKEK